MIVVVTAEAESDLEQIATYIADQSVGMALRFVQELRENVILWRMRRAAIPWCRATNISASADVHSAII
jgi:plasmid stabilization system protein ParE